MSDARLSQATHGPRRSRGPRDKMNNERGYTLAELLTSIAVVGLLMAAIFLTLHQGQAAYLFGAGRAEVQQNARIALDLMTSELRTGSQVSAATATSITFRFLDESSTPVTVTVQYSLNGTNLERNQTVPAPATAQPEVLIGGVSNLIFTYYDVNNVVTTAAASVRAVDIALTTQPEDTTLAPSAPGNQRAVVGGRVLLRNL